MAQGTFKTGIGKALSKIANNWSVVGDFIKFDLDGTNDKYATFGSTGIRRREGLARNSVSVPFDTNADYGASYLGKFNPYANTVYGVGTDGNKAQRLQDYRIMALYSEINNALDYICNEFISTNEKGEVATLKYLKPNANTIEETTIIEEFQYFTRLFDFKKNGANFCREYLVTGEFYAELILCSETPETIKEGILGVIPIQPELVDPVWKSKYAFILDSFIGRKPIYDPSDPSKLDDIQLVPYQANQLFYVSSRRWDSTGEYQLPFLERARRRYIQLTYIEDAIVIYRLVRAPERLIFTVPTGNMAPYEAERYMKTLMDGVWKQKVVDINSGDITQRYSPQSMTDAYYFSKPHNGEAINVTTLKGADNLGELKDLEFFLKALYRDMKTPSSYLNVDKVVTSDPSQILVEELRFADFICSIQRDFAEALLQAFITHMKLKGIWQRYQMHENHLQIEFNQPGTYYLMRELQITQMRNDIFNSVAGNQIISKIYALKRYFNWSDKEVLANLKFLKTESALLWEVEQRRAYGPSWKNAVLQQGAEGAGGEMGGLGGGDLGGLDLGGGMDGMGGTATNPPEFGGGPAAESGGPEPGANQGQPSPQDIQQV